MLRNSNRLFICTFFFKSIAVYSLVFLQGTEIVADRRGFLKRGDRDAAKASFARIEKRFGDFLTQIKEK